MPTLRELLSARDNDYSPLEARYRAETGAELVLRPWESFNAGPARLAKSASVLIGSYNSAPTLLKTLLSLEASSFNRRCPDLLEVIVVDDGSTDDTREVVCGTGLDLRLVYVRQANGGLTRAHNTGLAFASHDIVIFSDSDMVHTPYAIEEIMKRHEVLDAVTLVGFRFEIDPADPRIAPEALADTLPTLYPAFFDDFRLAFPGKPENMCRATRHFKDFGHGRTLRMANGADYDLPAMAVGAFMSLSRSDYSRMGGSDERLSGWGCEDSIIGARSIGLGNFIVPVFSAASGHVTHARRTPNESQEFATNLATLRRILDEPFIPDNPPPLEAYRARALEVIEKKRSPNARAARELPSRYPVMRGTAGDHAAAGRGSFALGDYDAALASYDCAARHEPDNSWHRLGRARSLARLGRTDDSFAAFEAALHVDARNCWAHFELGLARAAVGDFRAARASIEQARQLAPDVFDFAWALDNAADHHKSRGNHHARQSLHECAVQDFELALIVDAGNSWAHFDRGVSLRALDRPAEALASCLTADAMLHPDDGNRTWLHTELARSYMDLGRPSEAKLALETALRLWPANAEAARCLRELHEAGARAHRIHCQLSVLDRARTIDGWLTDEEADVLAGAAMKAASLADDHPQATFVEVGSYCGKSTVVIASTLQSAGRSDLTLHAIDPHQAYQLGRHADTCAILIENLQRNGVADRVRVIREKSTDVQWSAPIALLFIDGLHDYRSVAADFRHFSRWVVPGGLIAFHDYAEYAPGVRQCVNELLRDGVCEFITQRGALIVCRSRREGAVRQRVEPRVDTERDQ